MLWKKEYTTGIKEIDEQHRKIINIINSYKKCISNKNINIYYKIGSVLSFLTNYTSYHFDTEEEFLRSIKYPELEKQISMHRSFIQKLKKVLIKLKNKQSYTPIEFYYFLMNWLNNHIINEDMKIASYVKQDNNIELLPTSFAGYTNVEKIVLPNLNKYMLMLKNNLIVEEDLKVKRLGFLYDFYQKFKIDSCDELLKVLESISKLIINKHISELEGKSVSSYIVAQLSIETLLNKIDDINEKGNIKQELLKLGVEV